ncbi:MAG: 4-hydroxy-tetrahydrodipicolinate synthase [Acetobacteraceae bacterium]|nr:4-hydroxy-tetrahydrodipicolinate synthase [Acetobacteraceae bacterium]
MARKSEGLGGSLVALPTPFRDGRIDEPALVRLCARQIERGSSGLVVCGTTGEAPALSADEQARVIAITTEAAAGRVPVIAGCGAPATAQAVSLAATAARCGAAGLLCAPPPYVKPTQEGVIAHVQAVAWAAGLPVMLYDVPGRTGVAVADETIARLFERGVIAAIKDATANLARPPRLRALCGTGLLQLSGDDATAPSHRAVGGSGCVSVTANVTPALCASLHAAWDRGDLTMFATLRDLLHPLNVALFVESNPIPLKAALAELGLCRGELRLPLLEMNSRGRQHLVSTVEEVMPAEEAAAGMVSLKTASLPLTRGHAPARCR